VSIARGFITIVYITLVDMLVQITIILHSNSRSNQQATIQSSHNTIKP